MHDLGTLGGSYSSASGVNASNYIVGQSSLSNDSANHAFLYDSAMHDLGTLGGTSSQAIAINDNGVIVGGATIANDAENHPFMFDGSMHDLGTLGGNNGTARAINSNGIIVGNASLANGNSHAFLYDGTMHDLGTLGGNYSESAVVNDGGWVVGSSATTDGNNSLFVYDGLKMYDLSTLLTDAPSGTVLVSPLGINDTGDIFALAWNDTETKGTDSSFHLYKLNLTPVPIPASAWLLGSCLTGLIGLARKSKSS